MTILLWGDKVSMLIHIYPHKPQRKIKVAVFKITRLTADLCGLMSARLICNFIKSRVIHDPECLYWDQVSCSNTKPNQSNGYSIRCLSYVISTDDWKGSLTYSNLHAKEFQCLHSPTAVVCFYPWSAVKKLEAIAENPEDHNNVTVN